MSAYSTGRALSVKEAYDALDAYGQTFGRVPLLLLLHAAVPQSFRADMLDLLRLNFLAHEAGTDLTVEADVLFSPLVESAAAGYYRIDLEVRRHCLALLDAAYKHEPERRTVEVARFVLAYADSLERRLELALDPLLAEYLAIQRWVALAFIDPLKTAEEFAKALEISVSETEAGARGRLGTMAAALSIPLEGHEQLLAYARGLDALSRGEDALADGLLGGLGQEEIRVGGVVLQPRRRVAERKAEPAVRTEEAPLRLKIYISAGRDDRSAAMRIRDALLKDGMDVFYDEGHLPAGSFFEDVMRGQIRGADFFLPVVSRAILRRSESFVFREWNEASQEGLHRAVPSTFIIPLLVEPIDASELAKFFEGVSWAEARGGDLPEGFAASLRSTYTAGRIHGAAPPPPNTAPTLLPAYVQGMLEEVFRSEGPRVLLINGGVQSAIQDVPPHLKSAADRHDFRWGQLDFSFAMDTPEDVVRGIARMASVDESGMPIDRAATTDARQVRRLADWLTFALRDHRICILFSGFESPLMPWQILDLIRQLLSLALRRTGPASYVLLNFRERLPPDIGSLARRVELAPVTLQDVSAYLRMAFEQRGQHVSADVLAAATEEILNRMPLSGDFRTRDLQRVLDQAVNLLFQNL